MNQTQLDAITKSRIAANIELARTGKPLFDTDADYIAHVCQSAGLADLPDYAADSYAAQFAGKTVAELAAELQTAIDAAAEQGQYEEPPIAVVDERSAKKKPVPKR